jgi:hypothetical protein
MIQPLFINVVFYKTVNFSSWPNSVLQFNGEFWHKKIMQTNYKCWEKFLGFGFSRSSTISEPKDKVNYYFLGGGKFPKGGPYFLGNMAQAAKFFGGPNFLWHRN